SSSHPAIGSVKHRLGGFRVGLLAVLVQALGLSASDGAERAQKRILIEKSSEARGMLGGRVIASYESFDLVEVDAALVDALSDEDRAGIEVRDDLDQLELANTPFDTRAYREAPGIPAGLRESLPAGAGRMHLVQFVGPIQQAWLD